MFLRLVCALFLPPLAVFLTTGLSLAFVINIILTLRFFVTCYGSIGWHKSTKSLSGERFN